MEAGRKWISTNTTYGVKRAIVQCKAVYVETPSSPRVELEPRPAPPRSGEAAPPLSDSLVASVLARARHAVGQRGALHTSHTRQARTAVPVGRQRRPGSDACWIEPASRYSVVWRCDLHGGQPLRGQRVEPSVVPRVKDSRLADVKHPQRGHVVQANDDAS
jgi:hypothetical protein